MFRLARSLLGCFGVFALGAIGCREIVGIEDRTESPSQDHGNDAAADSAEAAQDSGDAAPACGIAYPAGSCEQCVERECCEKSKACAKDPSCAPGMACAADCGGDVVCRTQCVLAHRTVNTDEGPAINACIAANCMTECGLSCGSFAPAYTVESAQECEACIAAKVCDQINACVASEACLDLVACGEACPTMDCRSACANNNPGGLATYNAIWYAGGMDCGAQCAFGSDWRCVGHISWPAVKASTIRFTAFMVQAASRLPQPDARVQLCLLADCSEGPVGVTDSKGAVTLELENLQVGAVYTNSLFLSVEGPSGEPDPLIPTLVYWGYPLSEPESYLPPSVPTHPISLIAAAVDGLAGNDGGSSYDPSLGTILVSAWDCMTTEAPGMVFEASGVGEAVPRYYVNGSVSNSASMTDGTGVAVYFNVPPGIVDIAAKHAPTGRITSQATVAVRAGTLTFVIMQPTPLPTP